MVLAALALAGNNPAWGNADNGISGKYWFDNSAECISFLPGSFEVRTDGISEGLHIFNAYVEKDGVQSSVMSRWFLKDYNQLLKDTPKIYISIDGKHYDVIERTGSNGLFSIELPMAQMREGLHLLDATLTIGGAVSSTSSGWFVKTMSLSPGEKYKTALFIDGKHWKTLDTAVTGEGVISLCLDMNELPLGFHTLKTQLISPSGVPTSVKEAMFLRVPSTEQLSTLRGYYVIDGKYMGDIDPGIKSSVYNLDINVSELNAGLHSVSVYLASEIGISTTVKTAWFIKIPNGGEGVKKYEYWLNDNYDNTKTVTLDKPTDPFELVKLVDIDQEPFRTTSFSFAIENNTPVVYPLNDFQVRFSDSEGRLSMANSKFADVRGRKPVRDIEQIKESKTTLMPSVKDGELKWYSFTAEAGDSLALRFDRAAGYDLFAPDASELCHVSGADAMGNHGVALLHTGVYYLAVHDISNGYKEPSLYYEHIPRYALLSCSPEKASKKGALIMDISGNGFDKLKSIRIKNGSATLDASEWKVKDRYSLIARFEPEASGTPLGKYNLVAEYEDGTDAVVAKIDEAIELTESSKSNIRVDVVAPRIAQTPYEIYIDVKNESDQSCWGVPLNLAFEHSKNGMAVQFKDFYPVDINSKETPAPTYYLTSNLLNTGKKGVMFPTIVPYIGPNETIRLTVGLTTYAHEHVCVYAWNGTPWSDEFEEILSEGYDFEQINSLQQTNYLSAKALVYFNALAYEKANASGASSRRGIRKSWDRVNSAASVANNVSQATGMAMGGIVNGARLHGLNASLAAYGVDLSDETFGSLADYQNSLKQGMPTPGSVVAQAFGQGEIYDAANDFMNNCSQCPNPMPDPHTVDCYQSGDPNDMHGYTSPSGDKYIGLDVKTVQYTVEFENDPEIANASASVISVSNTLDGKSLDRKSFRPLKMIIGNKEVDLPAEHHFVKTLDMRTSINAIAELAFDYDVNTGEATWNIRSLDPMTMEPTKYMDDGVLPVNDDSKRGIGYLTYQIDLLDNLADGVEISNSAKIIFDDNDPIDTPVWTNITDYTRPTSEIVEISSDDNELFDFRIEGSDKGSGVWYYELYVKLENSDKWILALSNIETESFSYDFNADMSNAEFAVIAVDRAGNRQEESVMNALPGDADNNGEIDSNDVVVTRNYYKGLTATINKANADMTHDGKIDMQDATAIRNLYLDENVKLNANKNRKRKK